MCASQGVCTKPCGGAVKVKSASHGCMQCGAVRCSEVRSCGVDFVVVGGRITGPSHGVVVGCWSVG